MEDTLISHHFDSKLQYQFKDIQFKHLQEINNLFFSFRERILKNNTDQRDCNKQITNLHYIIEHNWHN